MSGLVKKECSFYFLRMARVSQEHLDARRRQILDGAARCFSRNGFHATSMQDVLREVNLSAGAVYRYFSGKDELITAIVTEVLGRIREAFEEAARHTPPPMPDVLVGRVMTQVLGAGGTGKYGLTWEGEESFPRLMIQVWTETLRDGELSAVLREGFDSVRDAWVTVVEGYQEAGVMRADIPAEHVARTLIAATQGFAVQQALFGASPGEVLQDGLRGLMSMVTPR
ncbi:TetR family transcriptional regulator [Streptomyces aurantiacus]|uniref:TetR family transcriptional regulator n=2 Tax=Streptomyces aurantiacus TaxID=47760 RepID=A0A7G1PCN1_9ACTN|nr:TetR family transcriptional regulator [Streptomyces aurantiacus]